MLTRSYNRTMRHGLPSGPDGEERAIDSNFPNGIGMKERAPKPLGGPVVGAGAAPAATSVLQRAPSRGVTPPALSRPTTPNAGGTITRGGVTSAYAPSPASDPRVNSGGTMTRNGVTTVVPPSVSKLTTPASPVAGAPTTSGVTQTESHNPLSGDGNSEAGETTDSLDPAQSLGLSQRGSGTPQGQDALPGISGGSGLYARRFGSQETADVYSKYVKKLFG